MDDGAKNRVRLWLRSERSLGLTAVRAPRALVAELPEAGAAPAAEPPRFFPQAQREDPSMARPLPITPAALPAFEGPQLPTEQKRQRLAEMNAKEVSICTRCRLSQTRTHTVFGEGDADAKLFFIGEGPGETEDETGRPFVGRAGQLLDKMIGGMGLKREQVFIANIVKCRPPGNRVPATDEVQTCTPYLERQLDIIRPKVIVTLGLPATRYMLRTDLSMGKLRGRWQSWRGIKLMPTYHPSYVLRTYTEETRAAVWSDLKQVMAELGLPIPARGK